MPSKPRSSRTDAAPRPQPETGDAIVSFSGEHFFLSNFYPHPVEVEGAVYPTNEHAFQALKTADADEREQVRLAPTPGRAKRLGRRVTLRPDWNSYRFEVMERLVREKFRGPELRRLLLSTGSRELIEGNTWNDRTWGCTRGRDGAWHGANQLGKALMRIRDELRAEAE
jgi:ribA/ribD-fused uncharacterized protein